MQVAMVACESCSILLVACQDQGVLGRICASRNAPLLIVIIKDRGTDRGRPTDSDSKGSRYCSPPILGL